MDPLNRNFNEQSRENNLLKKKNRLSIDLIIMQGLPSNPSCSH
ncbi:unnamed protein product [Arabidopsis halleri]